MVQAKMRVEKKQKVILLVPYPAQGHVTPMLNFAASLPALGFHPIMILPEFLHRQFKAKTRVQGDEVILPDHQIISIPDGLEEGPKGFFEIEKAMENVIPAHLERMIRDLQDGGDTVACLVADLLMSSLFDVASRCDVPTAGFWCAMLATYRLIAAIPELLQDGIIDPTGIPIQHGQISLQNDLPTINTEDLPWLIGSLTEQQSKFKFWVRALNRAKSLQWLLVNSYPNELQTTKSNFEHNPTIYPIGLLKKHDQIPKPTRNLTFWIEDEGCMDWLSVQKPDSVLYVSFGTWFNPSDKGKVKSLALSLEALDRPFLWALGPKWADGLPDGFKDRVSNRGKVVAWAPQVQVLQHKAVGCFLTHCGWNSITEAIRSKKCLVCYPLAGDQLLNCVFVVDVWKIGLKIASFDCQEMNDNVNRVLSDGRMKNRIVKLNDEFVGAEARVTMMDNVVDFTNKLNISAN